MLIEVMITFKAIHCQIMVMPVIFSSSSASPVFCMLPVLPSAQTNSVYLFQPRDRNALISANFSEIRSALT